MGVAVRDATKDVARASTQHCLRPTSTQLIASDLDILVELAGGIKPARSYVETALKRGVSVVTANKALMAECGTQLAQLAHQNDADLFYEAAVGGRYPDPARAAHLARRRTHQSGHGHRERHDELHPLQDDERGQRLRGALNEAQALGYAEADPSADVEGYDAAAKVQILSSLAFGTDLAGEEIAREGITGIRSVDVEFAKRSGYVIKLLGVAERVGDAGISRRAHPAMIPVEHPLASVHGAMNAVFVEGVKSGPLMWLGQGAGGEATATAVLGDLLDAARNRFEWSPRRPLQCGPVPAQRARRGTGERLLHQHRRPGPSGRARRGRGHLRRQRRVDPVDGAVGLRRRSPSRAS